MGKVQLFGTSAVDGCSASFAQRLLRGCGIRSYTYSHWFKSNILSLTLLCICLSGAWLLKKRRALRNGVRQGAPRNSGVAHARGDAGKTDPGLLKKHSTWESYSVPEGYTYPSIRTFYRPHPQYGKFPQTPTPIPLLVFVHGLGGSAAQFAPLLTSIVNVAPCLAIDFPGCGLSAGSPSSWDAYNMDSLVRLLAVAIEKYRDTERQQKVVLVGHSMGCSVSALLTSESSSYAPLLSKEILALIAICPKASPPKAKEVEKFRRLLSIPAPVFNLFRRWDQRGGIESVSVRRFAGPGADPETKKLQLRFNRQSQTPIWQRMAWGTLPDYTTGVPNGGLPGREIWSGIRVPLFLVAGEDDRVTSPVEMEKIAGFLGKQMPQSRPNGSTTSVIVDSAAPLDTSPSQTSSQHRTANGIDKPAVQYEAAKDSPTKENGTLPNGVLKVLTFPTPASHALLYAPTTSRVLSGLVQTFLADHADKRLSLGWQLQHLCTEGKWDVKNLAKWQDVAPVSRPIAGLFRAMKTLREVDERHCPKRFVLDWKHIIGAVCDISHEAPVYDPKGLEAGGIAYHKFPTVSKIPPTADEVDSFIAGVDRIRGKTAASNAENGNLAPATNTDTPNPQLVRGSADQIGVHCHYGFNRTGFFVVCYLVERMGFKLADAIDEFRAARPPGIRHEHFIDSLYVRYSISLKKAPTF